MSRMVSAASSAQQGIYFTERVGVAGSAYAMPLMVWFDGDLAVDALAAACGDVVAHHELLSINAADANGALMLSATDLSVQVVNVDLSADSDPDTSARRYAQAVVDDGFDLATGPLCRLALLRLRGDRHSLLVVAHHLVFDGTSKDIFLADLSSAYNARAAGLTPSLPPLGAPVAEALARQEEIIEGGRTAATDFWSQHWRAAGVPTLPGLTQLPATGSDGVAVPIALTPNLSTAINDAALECGASRFSFVAAALIALLARYGNDNLSIGLEMSTREETASGHIGMFVNELPLNVSAPEHMTVANLVRAVSAEVGALNPHRAVPLTRAGITLSPGTAALPVSISYRRRATFPTFVGVHAVVDWMLFNGAARNALHLQIVDDGVGLEGNLQFAPSAMSPAAAERIATHLTTVLAHAARDVSCVVADLDVLSSDEQLALMRAATGPATEIRPDETVVSRFRGQVRRTPDEIAATCRGAALTYGELDGLSDRMAHQLRARGIGVNSVVGVHIARSLDLLVVVFAVMKAGAAYLPLDPSFPADRIAYIAEDAGATIVLSDAGRAMSAPPPTGAFVLTLDELAADPRPSDGTATGLAGPRQTDLAYVIYTSGSTGRPKGVEIEHLSLHNLLRAFEALVGDGRDRWLAHTSLSFDISTLELFLPLMIGGRVVIASDDETRDGRALLALIREEHVSHVQATPSGWRMLLGAGFDEPTVVSMAGGEALSATLAAELRATSRRVINCYGPTEATVWCTVADLTEPDPEVTIGAPLANTSAYVVDERLQLRPLGITGELVVGGVALARGYRARPELTAEKFVADPFRGGRLYRTGDLAVVRPGGAIVCLGRTDNQVKLRGHRIELGEIEAALAAHPHVSQAVVVLDGDNVDGRLVAYVVSRAAPAAAHDLREHLSALLPEYMVPRAYVDLDAIPLTPNGKADRAQLRKPPRQPQPPKAETDDDVATDDPVVEKVRGIIGGVLRVPHIGMHDDLFDLGVHSLMITQMMARLHEALAVDIPLEVFFDTPTVAGVLAAIPDRM